MSMKTDAFYKSVRIDHHCTCDKVGHYLYSASPIVFTLRPSLVLFDVIAPLVHGIPPRSVPI